MSKAAEIIRDANRRGIAFRIVDGQLTWKAPAGVMTTAVKSVLKDHKTEIITELQTPDVLTRQRYDRPPDCEIQPTILKPVLSDREADQVTRYILAQHLSVMRWVLMQADRYDTARPQWQPPAVREMAAMLDCLLWQWEHALNSPNASRYARTREAMQKLNSVDQAAHHFDNNPPRKESTQ